VYHPAAKNGIGQNVCPSLGSHDLSQLQTATEKEREWKKDRQGRGNTKNKGAGSFTTSTYPLKGENPEGANTGGGRTQSNGEGKMILG